MDLDAHIPRTVIETKLRQWEYCVVLYFFFRQHKEMKIKKFKSQENKALEMYHLYNSKHLGPVIQIKD